MRVSTDERDPGFVNLTEYMGSMVYVDGEKVEKVFTADDDLGEVLCADLDENGNLRLAGDEVATRTLRGKVQIVKP